MLDYKIASILYSSTKIGIVTLIMIFLAFQLFFVPITVSAIESNVNQLLEKATNFVKQGNNDEAIKSIDKALELEPDNTNALVMKGITLYEIGNYQGALPIFNKVLEIEPDRTAALVYKGRVLLQNHTYQEAIKYFNIALAPGADPFYKHDVLFSKGTALVQLGNYEDAIKNFDMALILEPDEPATLANKGLALDALGKYDEAISYYDKALVIDPNNVDVLNNKGFAFANLGKYDEAISYYDKALVIDPNHPTALNNKELALKAGQDGSLTNNTSAATQQENATTTKPPLTPSGDQETTITPTTGNIKFLTYENSTLGIRIQYPSDWSVQEVQNAPNATVVGIVNIAPPIAIDPNAITNLEAGFENLDNNTSLDQYVRKIISAHRSDNTTTNFKVVSVTTTDNKFLGKPAYSLEYTDTSDGISRKSKEVGTIVEDKVYYVLFNTEAAKYAALIPTLQKMIDSLKLTTTTMTSSPVSSENTTTSLTATNQRIPPIDIEKFASDNMLKDTMAEFCMNAKGELIDEITCKMPNAGVVSIGRYSNGTIFLFGTISILNDKAIEFANLGKYDEAISYFDKMLKIEPNNTDALVNKGKVLDDLSKHQEAITYYDKALKMDPNNTLAINNKGVTLQSLGKYQEAITYYDKALKIDPNNTLAMDNKKMLLEGFNSTAK